jgi:predicted HAD superfamily phosphohydrolase YqeG
MTDIRAANRAGVKSILVRPVIDTDSWKTQLNRKMEKKIMKYLLTKHPEMKWQGEI